MEQLARNAGLNVGLLFAAAGLSTFLVTRGDYSDGRGMALIILLWFPLLVAVVSTALYFLARRFLGAWALLVTALGVAFLLALGVGALTSG